MTSDPIEQAMQALNEAVARYSHVAAQTGQGVELARLEDEIVRLRAAYNAAIIAYGSDE